MTAHRANGWTGGQYSVYRWALGAYLLGQFACLVPSASEISQGAGAAQAIAPEPLLADSPAPIAALLVAASAASLLLAIGLRDRVASLLLLACLIALHLGADPRIASPLLANAGAPFIGWLLAAHAFAPRRPYGSWDARGRIDPAGDWRLPEWLHVATWAALAIGVAYLGAAKLANPSWIDGSALSRALSDPQVRPGPLAELALLLPPPLLALATWSTLALEIGFAPLAFLRSARPWAWLALLGAQLFSLALGEFAGLNSATLMLQLLAFDPAWVRGDTAARPALIFYDGGCGLCHRFVRFALAEDREGERFRFAPLEGNAFAAIRDDAARTQALGGADGIVLWLSHGRLLVRGAAMLEIATRLGGLWRVAAGAARALPPRWLDAVYDGIAKIRHRLFAAPPEACPVLPAKLRARFDLS